MAATARAVDLTNVKEGGNFRPRRKPEGDYVAKIVKADDHQPKDTSKPMGWVLTIQIEGDARSTYPYYLSPEAKQAWKVGGICRAAGLNVKNARIKFDPNKLVNKTIGVALEDDEYEGRPKSVIADVFPKDEVSPNANEGTDEEYDDEVDAEIEEELAGDYDQDSDDEEEVEEEPEPEPAPRKRTARKRAPEPEPEEDDEEEDEDPAPAPRRRAKAPAKAAAPTRRKATPPPADEDDDLEDIDLDDLDE